MKIEEKELKEEIIDYYYNPNVECTCEAIFDDTHRSYCKRRIRQGYTIKKIEPLLRKFREAGKQEATQDFIENEIKFLKIYCVKRMIIADKLINERLKELKKKKLEKNS